MIRQSLSYADRLYDTIGCRRVVVDRHGTALTPLEAARDYGIYVPDLILVRADGWTVGCKAPDEDVAFELWPDDWIGFRRPGDQRSRPIEEYQPPKPEEG